METTHMSISWWMVIQNVVFLYNRKRMHATIWINWKCFACYAKWKKSVTKTARFMILFIWDSVIDRSIVTESRWLPGSACGGGWGVAASRVSCWNDKNSVFVVELCEHTKTLNCILLKRWILRCVNCLKKLW